MKRLRAHGIGKSWQWALGACVAAGIGVPATARAAAPAKTPSKSAERLSVSGDLSSAHAAEAARALVKRGDCAHALDQYDEALRTAVDPELHRERGMCHEQLGHPYPAMDDYRAYLVAAPDGKNADDVRARLARLEGETGQGGGEATHDNAEEPPPSSAHADGSLTLHAESGSGGASGEAQAEAHAESVDVSNNSDPTAAPDGKSYSAARAEEKKRDAANDSPLRLGHGFALGADLGVRRWFSDVLGWSETIVASFRYSFGAVSTVHADAGFMSIEGNGTASSMGGFMTFLGYEARLRLDPYATNAIIAGVGGGYERLSQGSVGATFSTFEGRGKLGVRHVFGPSLGLELAAEGGVANFSLVDAPSGTDSVTKGFLGGVVGLVVGF